MTQPLPAASEITFTMEEEDVLAFNEFVCSNSQSHRKAMRRAWLFVPCSFLGYALFLWHWGVAVSIQMALTFVALVWLAFYPEWARSRRRSYALKMYREGRNAGVYGLKQVRAEADGLHIYSDLVESRIAWVVVERIDQTPRYVFLFVSALSGVVVNRDNLHAGDLHEFVAACEEFRRLGGNTRFIINPRGSQRTS